MPGRCPAARADELRRRQEALIRTQRALEEDIAMGRQRDAQEKMRLLREMSRAKQDWQAAMDQQARGGPAARRSWRDGPA